MLTRTDEEYAACSRGAGTCALPGNGSDDRLADDTVQPPIGSNRLPAMGENLRLCSNQRTFGYVGIGQKPEEGMEAAVAPGPGIAHDREGTGFHQPSDPGAHHSHAALQPVVYVLQRIRRP